MVSQEDSGSQPVGSAHRVDPAGSRKYIAKEWRELRICMLMSTRKRLALGDPFVVLVQNAD